ncbi:cyclic dehypoxanthinyl futalosine synthase [Megalodesulfovibrio paquesii]
MFNESLYESLGLGSAYRKTLAGQRLSLEEGEALLACPDLHAVTALAHHARVKRHGADVHYVVNRQLNYTNVCVNRCRFCSFRREADQEGGYVMTVDAALTRLQQSGLDDAREAGEVHIVGGCHPELPLDYYLSLVESVKTRWPNVEVKAFTAVEIAHLARTHGLTPAALLERLKAAGLAMLPGGGAEVFSPRVRAELCPEKVDGETWLEVSRTAHLLGIPSNATMLFGHVESFRERVEHLDRLRRLQDETGGFRCFIPLPFLTKNNPLGERLGLKGPDATDILRTTAVSRLMLDNFPHIKAYWVMLGVRLAQIALHCGADDLDGSVVEERIGHEAGAGSPQGMTVDEIEACIRATGGAPVRRDALFRVPGAGRQAGSDRQAGTGGMAAQKEAIPFHSPLEESESIAALARKGAAGERLSRDELLTLGGEASLHTLGRAAALRSLAMHPERLATYVVDRNINTTNICECGCAFCAFHVKAGEQGGYVLTADQVADKIQELFDLGGRQVLMQGGHNPACDLAWHEGLFHELLSRFPTLHLHALSAPEIFAMAEREGLAVATVIARLKAAGLRSIPGAGAEILVDAIRQRVSPNKCSTAQWLGVMAEAHRQGMLTSATMMFGHVETLADRVAHFLAIRNQQDATGGFIAFIPWTFQPGGSQIARDPAGPVVYLRTLALARLALDNVPNLQASWVTMGPQVGQLALFFGANDLGSTMLEENVVAAAGTVFKMKEQELRDLATAAGFTPRRRDQAYRVAE